MMNCFQDVSIYLNLHDDIILSNNWLDSVLLHLMCLLLWKNCKTISKRFMHVQKIEGDAISNLFNFRKSVLLRSIKFFCKNWMFIEQSYFYFQYLVAIKNTSFPTSWLKFLFFFTQQTSKISSITGFLW